MAFTHCITRNRCNLTVVLEPLPCIQCPCTIYPRPSASCVSSQISRLSLELAPAPLSSVRYGRHDAKDTRSDIESTDTDRLKNSISGFLLLHERQNMQPALNRPTGVKRRQSESPARTPEWRRTRHSPSAAVPLVLSAHAMTRTQLTFPAASKQPLST